MRGYVAHYSQGAIMVIISLIVMILSINIPKQNLFELADGSFFPTLISLIMLISGIVQLYESAREKPVQERKEERESSFTVPVFIVIFFLYIILLNYFSFFILSFLFLVIIMFYLRGVSLLYNIFISIGTIVALYLIFTTVFGIVFP